MKQLNTVKARESFSDLVSSVSFGKERIIITRNGKKAVAMVPVEDMELLEKIEDMIDIEAAKKALQEVEAQGTTSLADFKKELGLDN